MQQKEILQLALYIFSGFVLGFIVQKLVIPQLAKVANKTTNKTDDIIIAGVKKWIILWFIALGLYVGIRHIEIDKQYYNWIENGIVIFIILSFTILLAKIISGMLSFRAKDPDAIIPSSSIISNIVRAIIYCFGLLFILQSQGISITPMLTALGVGGLAVALALHNTLSNLFAGLQILSSGKINHGDFVKLSSGEEGFIQDITWRSTTIQAMQEHIIIVPNSKLADMIVSNYFLDEHEIIFSVEIGVSYDSDLDEVERVTNEVIKETMLEVEGGVKDFEPVIRFKEFGESSINLKAILRVKTYVYQFTVKHEFIKRLHARYKLEGINIPFPMRTVIMKQN